MTDSTRVNDVQEKLLQAMSIVNGKLLETISYDTTITATITDNTDKADGKYILSDGCKTFTAYSSITNYSNNTTVYVTIPNGKWENQKMIIGKKTSDAETPFVFTTPFDTIFDMTGNITNKANNVSLLANGGKEEQNNYINERVIFQYPSDDDTYNLSYSERLKKASNDANKLILISSDYTRLGLSADFCTWIKNAVTGTYGIKIELSYLNSTTANEEDIEITPKYWVFENSQFYGNTYDFESFYNQQIVFNISDYGAITKLKLSFREFDDFKDENGIDLRTTDNIADSLLFDNMFVKDVYLCAGHDIGVFQDDYVEIYTEDKLTYDKSQYGTEDNKRTVNLRWVHVEDGTPVKIEKSDFDAERDEIRWYRYHIGEKAADDYCGVYWEYADKEYTVLLEQLEKDIEDANQDEQTIEKLKKAFEEATKNITPSISQGSFSITFVPNTEWQQEKLKVIVFRDKVPYRSNELVFENQEEVPSQNTIIYQNALGIVTDDNSNGSYMFYGQNGRIKESEASNKERSLLLNFDPTGSNRASLGDSDYLNAIWYLPAKNTMFHWLNTGSMVLNDDETKYILKNTKELPKYKISGTYNPGYNDNTVTCEYTTEGRTYTGIKEFSFGKFGTMGTEQTVEVNWVDPNITAIDLDKPNQVYKVQVSVTDKEGNNLINTADSKTIAWDWYKTSISEDMPKHITITKDTDDASICQLTPTSGITHNELYILQVAIGDLVTYFNIPLKSGDCTHIEGTSEVYYQADGIPETYRNPYQLFNGNAEITTTASNWSVISTDTATTNQKRYDPLIDDNKRLQVMSIYVEDAPMYGVSCKVGTGETACQWTQPVLVIQNNYPSSVVNNWDGKSLQIDSDTGTILGTALAAGSKDDDNRFTGVMIGDWSEGKLDTEASVSNRTGVYGLHEGALSYAFMDDGKAFIGKSGIGRILFDGDEGIIQSASYESNNNGIKMSLTKPYLLLNNDEKNKTYSVATYPFQIGTNFRVNWNGNLYANNGDFTGTIYANQGKIGGWIINETSLSNQKGTVKLESSGTITGATITGGYINGTTITTENLYAGIAEGYEYNIYRRETAASNWMSTSETMVFSEFYGQIVTDYLTEYRYKGKIINSEIARLGSFTGSANEELSTAVAGISITKNNIPLVLEATERIRITSKNGIVYISGKELVILGDAAKADNQTGIYARFA